ncbi:hypothetical protein ACG98H_10450 [Corynebacterium sp. L4756]|uniref:hypothetical protein n=1 Tax=unclassified Corynebacterium TaxID=2624378 RepID=UPI00374D9C88
MTTELRKSSKILLAGMVAAGLSVPALDATTAGAATAPAAQAQNPEIDSVASQALYRSLYDQLGNGRATNGQAIKLGDRDATLCMMGDGYGVHGLAAGPNTSCDFAGEVFAGLMAKTEGPSDNARNHTPTTINAHSPVTNLDYDMKCVTGQDNLVTCSGGNNAAVYLF